MPGKYLANTWNGRQCAIRNRSKSDALASGKAAIGIFITLDKWDTPSVKKCIAHAGMLRMGAQEYNRLIMYTIDEYFQNIEPPIPPLAHPRTGEAFQTEQGGQSNFLFQKQ